jgi:predicted transcriptional regulator
MNAHEINDLFEQESQVGQLYVRLKDEPGVCLQEIQARLRTSKA